MTYRVVLTVEAEEDLLRLFDFLLERESARDGGNIDLRSSTGKRWRSLPSVISARTTTTDVFRSARTSSRNLAPPH